MSFGKNLIALRESRGVSRKELAESLGIPYTTLRNYENDQREPGHKLLVDIAHIFRVSVDELVGNQTNTKSAPFLSNEALDIVSRYEAATPEIKAAVRAVLSVVTVTTPITVSAPKKVIPIFNTAAGSGDPESDIGWETYETENLKADFAIHVVGNSMEPLLPDGSVALGVRRMPRDGEVAAFRLDGEFLVKQVCQDSEGNVYLFSVNRNRSDADQTIWRSSGRDLWCFGTILCDRVPLPD